MELDTVNIQISDETSDTQETYAKQQLGVPQRGQGALLGVSWDMVADTIQVKFPPERAQPTKRGLLAKAAKIYDPLGLVSPTTLCVACSAGVFIGRARMVLIAKAPCCPHTYRKGYYFYSPQSSSVIESKMATSSYVAIRLTSLRPPKIRLHCRLRFVENYCIARPVI